METSEVEAFDNREEAYIAWVSTHPQGFVANMDRAGDVPQYPMIHRATHGAISSAKIGSFTTGDYMKYCAVDVDALRNYLVAKYRKQPTLCRNCGRLCDVRVTCERSQENPAHMGLQMVA